MRNIYSFIVICTILMCCACGGKSPVSSNEKEIAKDGLYRIKITLSEMDTLQDIYLSEIADSVCYVALSDETPLPGYLRAEITDSAILVSSVRQDLENLKLYDFNGDFKKNIGARGRGNGEYLDPTWGVNVNTNEVYVYSRGTSLNSIQIYDLLGSNPKMTKKMINEKAFFPRMREIIGAGRNILMMYPSSIRHRKNQIELVLYDLKTNTVIDSLINYNNLLERPTKGAPYFVRSSSPICFGYKSDMYYMNTSSDTLYKITEKEIAPFAIFDFGKYKFRAEVGLLKNKDPRTLMSENKHITLSSILRTSNKLYAQFSYKPEFWISHLYFSSLYF